MFLSHGFHLSVVRHEGRSVDEPIVYVRMIDYRTSDNEKTTQDAMLRSVGTLSARIRRGRMPQIHAPRSRCEAFRGSASRRGVRSRILALAAVHTVAYSLLATPDVIVFPFFVALRLCSSRFKDMLLRKRWPIWPPVPTNHLFDYRSFLRSRMSWRTFATRSQ